MKRIVIVDAPATPVVIVAAYADTGERIEVSIMPHRALALAEQLLTAARRRLHDGGQDDGTTPAHC